jgi:hypothetical protein
MTDFDRATAPPPDGEEVPPTVPAPVSGQDLLPVPANVWTPDAPAPLVSPGGLECLKRISRYGRMMKPHGGRCSVRSSS